MQILRGGDRTERRLAHRNHQRRRGRAGHAERPASTLDVQSDWRSRSRSTDREGRHQQPAIDNVRKDQVDLKRRRCRGDGEIDRVSPATHHGQLARLTAAGELRDLPVRQDPLPARQLSGAAHSGSGDRVGHADRVRRDGTRDRRAVRQHQKVRRTMRGGRGEFAHELRGALSTRQPYPLELARDSDRGVAAVLLQAAERIELLQVGRTGLLVDPLRIAQQIEAQMLDGLAILSRIIHRRISAGDEDPLPCTCDGLRLPLHIRPDHPWQQSELLSHRSGGQAVAQAEETDLAVDERGIEELGVPRQHQRRGRQRDAARAHAHLQRHARGHTVRGVGCGGVHMAGLRSLQPGGNGDGLPRIERQVLDWIAVDATDVVAESIGTRGDRRLIQFHGLLRGRGVGDERVGGVGLVRPHRIRVHEIDLESGIADHDGRADTALQRDVGLAVLLVGRVNLHVDGVRPGAHGLETPVGRSLRLRGEEDRVGLAVADRNRLPDAHRRIHLHHAQSGGSADRRSDRVDGDARTSRSVVADVQQHAEKLVEHPETGGDDQRCGNHRRSARGRRRICASRFDQGPATEVVLHDEGDD